MEEVKKCSKCLMIKSLSMYYGESTSKDGRRSDCKECNNKTRNVYRKKNRKILRSKHKEWRIANEEYNLKRQKEWYRINKRRKSDYVNEYSKRRRKLDPLFALKTSIRSVIASSFSLKGYKKDAKAEQILGCSFVQFKSHIETRFKPGMSWANRSEWHIDHIIPLASAKTEEEVIKLCHYTNLQPLWAHENLRKGAKHDKPA